ncbi:MAG: gamma-glutamyl-gamma-aminobutyrate hydrolase family protein [Frankia sp.]
MAREIVVGVPLRFWQRADRPVRVMQSAAYLTAIERAGAIALPIPPTTGSAGARSLLTRCDGLCLPGGADVGPDRYGQAIEPGHGVVVLPSSDELELDLAAAALDGGLPVLGVCRGLQVINTVRGGDLWQDLGRQTGIGGHRGPGDNSGPGGDATSSHPVTMVAGSRLGRLLDALTVDGRIRVNSRHHQAVRRLGAGLRASGHAPDGVVEALEADDHPFAVAVQWHPEELDDEVARALFAALVRAAGSVAGRVPRLRSSA